MSLKNDAIPSSTAFDLLASSIASDKAAAIKQGNGVYAFTIKSPTATDSWYIDLKKSGTVGKGLVAPEGGKANVTLTLSDADFQSMIDGKAQAQQMFMSGKLKIKGNVMMATKLEPVLKRAKPPGSKL